MAECNMVMSQSDVSALKETLCAQQLLLQKLYNELDAEREASATAASEALSVILRLQGEKAAVKMEAEHYKRLSEEKMCHAEESLAIIEDVICQKEMEVAALDYQVQAYRYKLISLGLGDPGISDLKLPENLLQMNESLARDKGLHSIGRRNSAPLLPKYKRALNEREILTSMEIDLEAICKPLESNKNTDNSAPGSISSYWEQIRKLDERVKEIAGANVADIKDEIRSQPSTDTSCDPSNLQNEMLPPSPQLSIDLINRSANVAVDCAFSPSVHDVFEVPQADQNLRPSGSLTKDRHKKVCQCTLTLETGEDSVHPNYTKDEPDWLKKLLKSRQLENNLCKPSEIAAIDCQLALVQPSVSESHPRMNQGNRRSEITEVERPVDLANRENELNLLNEIKEKLNSLHDEIRSLKIQKRPTRDDSTLQLLSEAMVYFWL